jgi:hypothetical protein
MASGRRQPLIETLSQRHGARSAESKARPEARATRTGLSAKLGYGYEVSTSVATVDIAIVSFPVPGLPAPTDVVTMSIGVTHLLEVGSARGHRVHLRIRHPRCRGGRDLNLQWRCCRRPQSRPAPIKISSWKIDPQSAVSQPHRIYDMLTVVSSSLKLFR